MTLHACQIVPVPVHEPASISIHIVDDGIVVSQTLYNLLIKILEIANLCSAFNGRNAQQPMPASDIHDGLAD